MPSGGVHSITPIVVIRAEPNVTLGYDGAAQRSPNRGYRSPECPQRSPPAPESAAPASASRRARPWTVRPAKREATSLQPSASRIIVVRLSSRQIGSRTLGGTGCFVQSVWPKTRRRVASVPRADHRCPRHAQLAVSRTSPPPGSAVVAANPLGKSPLRLRRPRRPSRARIQPSAGSSRSCSAIL